jgi:NADH:ubiquinone oxidoreductase subunit H
VRIRADQIMRVSWKLMLPATLLLLLATAVTVVLRAPHA